MGSILDDLLSVVVRCLCQMLHMHNDNHVKLSVETLYYEFYTSAL